MKITILTLFPEMVANTFNHSILKRAKDKQTFELEIINIRDFTKDKHKHVDDTPYGGGAGMLMQIEPIDLALQSVKKDNSWVMLTSPKAKPFNQKKAQELSKKEHLIFICGHYEGVDARVDKLINENISLGDFILTGGELATLTICDAIIRLLDKAITKESLDIESYDNNLLEYPQYTKPYDYHGDKVPDILLSGHHKNIEHYRKKMSIFETLKYRKDLLDEHIFTKEEKKILNELLEELKTKEKPD